MDNFREYEVMIPIFNVDEITKKFIKNGAKIIKQVYQIDEYYDYRPLKLSKQDELLRIRSEFDQQFKNFINGEFSWKSSRRGVEKFYEVRDDISITINNENSLILLKKLLTKLNIEIIAKLEKIRDRWTLNYKSNNIDFEFDKKIIAMGAGKPKKDIGPYLQATIETSENISDDYAKKILWDVLQSKFGFNIKDFEPRSYIEIFLGVKKPFKI
ncbi:MAG: CYTH domain-containing protein [Candidatus Helarchaeota archaeon]